jgi:hypothetical protein
MNIQNILTSEMPELPESVIELINNGVWHLYSKLNPSNEEVYMLKTDDITYSLDSKGKVLKERSFYVKGVEIDSIIYFSNYPRPRSLSNA